MGTKETQPKMSSATSARPVGMQTMTPDLYLQIRQAVVELTVRR